MYYIKIPTVRFTGLVRPDPQGELLFEGLKNLKVEKSIIYLFYLNAARSTVGEKQLHLLVRKNIKLNKPMMMFYS